MLPTELTAHAAAAVRELVAAAYRPNTTASAFERLAEWASHPDTERTAGIAVIVRRGNVEIAAHTYDEDHDRDILEVLAEIALTNQDAVAELDAQPLSLPGILPLAADTPTARDPLFIRARAMVSKFVPMTAWAGNRYIQPDEELRAILDALQRRIDGLKGPIPLILHCPTCGVQHVDREEWESRPHRTHLCEGCGHTFRPANVATVGVVSLPAIEPATTEAVTLGGATT